MFWRKSQKEANHGLAGRWAVDPTDATTIGELGDAVLQFDPDGRLTYTIRLPDKDQIMLLTYRVQGNIIITDQPSHPDEQRSEFEVTEDKLMVAFGGQRSHFVRL
ncbi:hypothetical protein [Sphingomonas sp. OTU376]|uniref:hypothetical protein n=1 Tax=Sphingomonas sp. OTU376 TaxID=3043863 RepID=UPI00313C207A